MAPPPLSTIPNVTTKTIDRGERLAEALSFLRDEKYPDYAFIRDYIRDSVILADKVRAVREEAKK